MHRGGEGRAGVGMQKLAVMGNLGYLIGIAEGPLARRRRENSGRF